MLRVGVLGGTRFIGFHLVSSLLARGDAVSILHRGRTIEPEPFRRPVERVTGARRDQRTLDTFFRRSYDAVIDVSGYTAEDVNPIVGRWRHRIGHYLFVSTSSVYQLPVPVLFSEAATLVRETGTYGGDKAVAERCIREAGEAARWPVTIFRPQGVLGPFGAEQMLYVARRALAGKPILVRPGAAEMRINLLWVGDLVSAVLRALDTGRTAAETFNVAGAAVCDTRSFVAAVARAGDVADPGTLTLTQRVAEHCTHLGLPWLDHDLVTDTSKISRTLGVSWTPIDAWLNRLWHWARAEPPRLQPSLQRWEREAAHGRVPPAWTRCRWNMGDRARAHIRT